MASADDIADAALLRFAEDLEPVPEGPAPAAKKRGRPPAPPKAPRAAAVAPPPPTAAPFGGIFAGMVEDTVDVKAQAKKDAEKIRKARIVRRVRGKIRIAEKYGKSTEELAEVAARLRGTMAEVDMLEAEQTVDAYLHAEKLPEIIDDAFVSVMSVVEATAKSLDTGTNLTNLGAVAATEDARKDRAMSVELMANDWVDRVGWLVASPIGGLAQSGAKLVRVVATTNAIRGAPSRPPGTG